MRHTALDAITELMLETFRLNGRLLAAGDVLVAGIGLTSARWQVLGAIALNAPALPVAHIARNMGLTRQAVQRTVNEMAAEGLVRFAPNPHHRRAKLVELTPQGEAAYAGAIRRHRPWATNLARGLSVRQLDAAHAVLRRIREQLEAAAETDDA
ncbi:MarR family winged helix-turn-helix transcriptional regulator [Dongia sp.]|uniref:MarR family winged helix-turn-helix transcriptional regulator n=1 Tax=Dongia sp. TaxID=1977262 RepID=UPI0035ADF082